MEQQELIPMEAAMSKFNLSRTTIDRRCKEGLIDKFTLPGSRRVFVDEKQIRSAFVKKLALQTT